jgi:hypothetical protein
MTQDLVIENTNFFSVDILDKFSGTDLGLFNGRTVCSLNKPIRFLINGEFLIVVPAGFQTDLASVPRVPIIYSIWGDRAHREAILHDYLYRIDSIYCLKKSKCDQLFKLAMISQDCSWGIYQPMYIGVKFGGGSSYHQFFVDHKFIK